MPTYEFNCPDHGDFEKRMPMSAYSSTQECPTCDGPSKRVIRTPGAFTTPGDSWATKNGRIRRQMQKKNARMRMLTEQQKREAPPVTLAPNVEGEQTDTWAEAQKLAESKGLDGSSYDKQVYEEQNKHKNKIEVNP